MTQKRNLKPLLIVFILSLGLFAGIMAIRQRIIRPKAASEPHLNFTATPLTSGQNFTLKIQVNPNNTSFNAFELHFSLDGKVEFQDPDNIPSNFIKKYSSVFSLTSHVTGSEVIVTGAKTGVGFGGADTIDLVEVLLKVKPNQTGQVTFPWNPATEIEQKTYTTEDGQFAIGMTNGARLYFSSLKTAYAKGENFPLMLYLDTNGKAVSSLDFKLNYDSSALEFQFPGADDAELAANNIDVSPNSGFDTANTLNMIDSQNQLVRVGLITDEPGVGETGVRELATITFKVKQNTTISSLSFTALQSSVVYDLNTQNILTDRPVYEIAITSITATPNPTITLIPTPTSCQFCQVGEPSGIITFHSNRDGDNEIYTLNVDETIPSNLTNNPEDDQFPSFSPDGNTIAFMSERDASNWDIWKMDRYGDNLINLTNGNGSNYYPKFLPDGNRIAFHSNREGGDWDIWTMNAADGTDPQNLTSNDVTNDYYASFSPDGDEIVFMSDGSGNWEIWKMNADGTVKTNLSNNGAMDTFPSFSPDGTKIIFMSARENGWEVYEMDSDGSNQEPLTSNINLNSFPNFAPAFSPDHDGTWIIYSNTDPETNKFQVYRMLNNGSEPTRITSNSAGDSYTSGANSWIDIIPTLTPTPTITPTPTEIPPTFTPTPSITSVPTATLTPSPTAIPTCYDLWVAVYGGAYNASADFNDDDKVDLVDFEMCRRGEVHI